MRSLYLNLRSLYSLDCLLLIIDELNNMKMIDKIGSVFEVGSYDTAVGLIEIRTYKLYQTAGIFWSRGNRIRF